MSANSAHKGFYLDSGVQKHSVGDSYPLTVSVRENALLGDCEAYVWNCLTGVRLASFAYAYGDSLALKAALKAAHDYLRPCVENVCKFTRCNPQLRARFIQQLRRSTRREYLDNVQSSDLLTATLYTNRDMSAGLAVHEGEIRTAYNVSGRRGAILPVLQSAMLDGANRLNCFDGFLPRYYAHFGFCETGRAAFCDALAPENWPYDRLGRPDVVFMEANPKYAESPLFWGGGLSNQQKNIMAQVENDLQDLEIERGGNNGEA